MAHDKLIKKVVHDCFLLSGEVSHLLEEFTIELTIMPGGQWQLSPLINDSYRLMILTDSYQIYIILLIGIPILR